MGASTRLRAGRAAGGCIADDRNWTTPAGARVYFVENRELPIVDVSVDFSAGSSFDKREKSGVAALTQYMLRFGAGGLTEAEIANRIADVGAQLTGRFDLDRAGLGVRTLASAREQDAAIDVLAKMLQSPSFPADAVAREKARHVAGLKEADTKPETIASKAFYATLYGDHPYAMPTSGDARDRIRAHPRGSAGVLSRALQRAPRGGGDHGRRDARAGRRHCTPPDRWSAATPKEGSPLPGVTPLDKASEKRIAHPATQSHILIGAPGMRRDDPDYFALFVGNYMLGGGGFVSRFIEEVRSKRGLAYSVVQLLLRRCGEGPVPDRPADEEGAGRAKRSTWCGTR